MTSSVASSPWLVPVVPECHAQVAPGWVDKSAQWSQPHPIPSPGTPQAQELSNIQLSPNFTAGDLSNWTWPTHQWSAINLAWSGAVINQLSKLANTLLEPIQAHYGTPLAILSALRWATPTNNPTPHTNNWTGMDVETRSIYARRQYQPRSSHLSGMAADFLVPGQSCQAVWEWILHHHPCPWGELRLECVGGVGRVGWIHLSIPHHGWGTKHATDLPLYGHTWTSSIDSMGRARSCLLRHHRAPKHDRWPQALEWERHVARELHLGGPRPGVPG